MNSLSNILKRVMLNKNGKFSHLCTSRLLSYSSIYYDDKDPATWFFNNEIQSLLKSLTRADYNKVFRKRKLGHSTLNNPQYKFMTDEELQQALKEAQEKAEELLQIPPVIKVRTPVTKIISKDPALKGLDSSRIVFTDITYGVSDSNRVIVVREPDGTLKEAECELRHRMNQVYFPTPGKFLKTPSMFQDNFLESLLDRHEYEFVLDRTCLQFEPDDPVFQRLMSITYQHLNDNNKFDSLRSTRHFGGLVFFLVWNKNIDNLLLDLIETLKIEEAHTLVTLYSKIHDVTFEGTSDMDVVESFIKKAANKKGALELAIQAYREVAEQQENLRKGIQKSHGISE